MSQIEVLAEVDALGDLAVRVFVDGVESHGAVVYSVDPGAGYTGEDWDEETAYVATYESYSPAFRGAIVAARSEARATSRYITD